MKRETPEEKWNRIQRQVHEDITKGYPNRERTGCPGHEDIVTLAIKAANFDDAMERDPHWHHVTHCSPCYGEYLEEFGNRRTKKSPAKPE